MLLISSFSDDSISSYSLISCLSWLYWLSPLSMNSLSSSSSYSALAWAYTNSNSLLFIFSSSNLEMSFCDFFSSSRQMISPLSSEFSSIRTSMLAESFSTSKLKSAARVGIYLLRSLSEFLPSALYPMSKPRLCLCSVRSSFLLGDPEVMPTFYGCKSLRVCWSISCFDSIAVLWAYCLASRSVRSILSDFSRSDNWALI